MTATDHVLCICFDNPWGTGSYAEHPADDLIHAIEEGYGVTADDSSYEALARQWCELRGFGFVDVGNGGPLMFQDLSGGVFFRVKGHDSRGLFIKLASTLKHGVNAVNTEGGRFEHVDARVEVQPVTMKERAN